jgi:hypothetical protein
MRRRCASVERKLTRDQREERRTDLKVGHYKGEERSLASLGMTELKGRWGEINSRISSLVDGGQGFDV